MTVRVGNCEEKVSLEYLNLSTAELLSHLQFISMAKTCSFSPSDLIGTGSDQCFGVFSPGCFKTLALPFEVSLEVPPTKWVWANFISLCHLESRFRLCPEAAQHFVCLSPYIEETSLLKSRPITRSLCFYWNRNDVGKDQALFAQGREKTLLWLRHKAANIYI